MDNSNYETLFEALYNEIEDLYLGASRSAKEIIHNLNTMQLNDMERLAMKVKLLEVYKDCNDAIDIQLNLLPQDEWLRNAEALGIEYN